MNTTIREWLAMESACDAVVVQGWVRTRRDSKAFSFLELNDGSCLRNLQCVVDAGVPGYDRIAECTTGAAVRVEGRLVASPGGAQKWEVRATALELVGGADETFPLQKKGHTPEFLRTVAHLRPRTNLYGSIFRVRSRLSYAVHRFFQERGFFHVHTPILTASDCEGAGEMFRVTTLPAGEDDFAKDFFARQAFLTVSGQLEGETFATALGRIYTFGPTFRAENSNTTRHAAEFWMIEPEMAFCDLAGDMETAEAQVKYLARAMLEESPEELEFLNKFVDKGLRERLEFVAGRPFERLPYAEAVDILQRSGRTFEYPVEYGQNLQSEHERWLTEEHCRCPVTVFDYPKEIKPFYMRLNDDGRTVAAMDLLVPGIGEIVGGSQREERLDVLRANMARHHLSEESYWWYVDLRRYGSVPHAGYGLGFERLLMLVTGVSNIRDVIPFARTPGHCEF